MRRILLGVDFSSYSDRTILDLLFEGLPLDTRFRLVMIARKAVAPYGPGGIGRLALPTAAFVVPMFTPAVTGDWAGRQVNSTDEAANRASRLARPLIATGYSVETSLHEGSVLSAIRSEIRSWKPTDVIIAINHWYGLKRKVVEFVVQAMPLEDDSDHDKPPVLRKRAA